MESPAEYNLVIRKGNDFNELFEFQNDDESPMDLTGWTVKSQIRKKKGRSADLIVAFTVEIPDPTDGKVYLKLTDTQTGNLEAKKGFYDILMTAPSGFDETYVIGQVTFDPTVTEK